MTQKLQDSGQRRKFKTGAVRDRGDLKPRPDLISPHANMREGMINTLGSIKYSVRNWEQGIPISECLASAQRHIEQYKRGDTDEDHLAQARWNLGAMIHFEEEIKAGRLPAELDDMPKYRGKPIRFEVLHEDEIGKTIGDNVDKVVRFEPNPHPRASAIEELVLEPKHYYIAGPMRGIPFCNFPLFDRVTEAARAQGFDITSPAELDRDHGIDPVTDPNSVDDAFAADPNLTQTLAQRDCGVILNLEKGRGDGLILLPDWPKSIGTRAEVALALWLGLTFKFACVDYGYDPLKITFEDAELQVIEKRLFHQES